MEVPRYWRLKYFLINPNHYGYRPIRPENPPLKPSVLPAQKACSNIPAYDLDNQPSSKRYH